jgi:hypothetical protein
MNKIKLITLLIFTSILLSNCSPYGKGDKILFVDYEDDVSKVNNESFIKEALEKGGSISVNVDVLRKIDPDFDKKYAVLDEKGEFLVKPAVLNFIGGQGWHLNSFGMVIVFVKGR